MDLKNLFIGKFSINSLLIGVASAVLILFLFFPSDYTILGIPLMLIYILILITIIVYLLVELIKFISTKKKERSTFIDQEKKRVNQNKQFLEKLHQEIWLYFNTLPEDKINTLMSIYKHGEKDNYDKFIRIIDTEGKLNFSPYTFKDRFTSNINSEYKYSCFDDIRLTNEKIIFKFDEYFFKLLEHYSNTGTKSKI